ncbi:MAG: hypothetical protein M3R45_17175 [Pseudomonadota bacterium]|nr:hypothetical protein [Pseudomonadota bacterium]
MKPLTTLSLACALGLSALSAPVRAEPIPLAPASLLTTPAAAVASPVSELFDKPVATELLERHRGGSDSVHNDMTLTGTTTGNTAIQVATGNNAIGSGSFAGMSGLPVVIQNSGANVLIQNAVILHLEIN